MNISLIMNCLCGFANLYEIHFHFWRYNWFNSIEVASRLHTKKDKKHSENADTSMSVTFDLDVWPWPHVKVKKAYLIRYWVLHCTLVPDAMSVALFFFFFVTLDLLHLWWPLAYVNVIFTLFITCTLCCSIFESGI